MEENIKNRMQVSFESRSGNETLARMVAAAFMVQADPTVDELEDIKTAVSEAVTNSIIHGYGVKEAACGDGKVSMEMTLYEDCVVIRITDTGCGIADVPKAMEAFYSGDESGERSGMGFTLMQAFMSELRVASAPGEGTTVWMKTQLSER
jgi:stage II sporulation protein AB (anti-sigma F factor)